jgi:hypothetical protein
VTAVLQAVLVAALQPIGETILHAFELPTLDNTPSNALRVTIVAAGTGAGWRRAALQYSVDEGASWTPAGTTGLPGVVGHLTAPVDAGTATLVDRRATIDVALVHSGMALTNADPAALDRGANLALVGDELLQFGVAEHLGGVDWRLSELWRGRRGTAAVAGAEGTRFVLLDDDAALVLPVAATPGMQLRVSASGASDETPAEVDVPLDGASILPPPPVRLTATFSGSGIEIRWRRRSRTDWRWRDAVDAALGEEQEGYCVDVSDETGSLARYDVAEPALFLPGPAPSGPVTIVVRQRGTNGLSRPATILIQGTDHE